MSDFTVLKKDGYKELTFVNHAIKKGLLNIETLWSAVAIGDTEEAAKIVLGANFEPQLDDVQILDVRDLILVSLPDGLIGENYRIWVKLKKKAKA